jgi:hypothetical protein
MINTLRSLPTLPREKLVTASGDIHPAWRSFHGQLLTYLQANLSQQGYKVPQLTPDQITQLEADSNTVNTLVIDSTNDVAKINLNGTFKTIQTV